MALVVLGATALTVGIGTGTAFSASCSLSSLRPVEIGQNTFVYAADGSLLGSIPAERNRQPVPLGQISPWLSRAAIAVEDRRFYEHGGVDYEGIARALWRDVSAGKVVEGGSTIAQQLVRNLYTGRERTFERKIKEACLAIKLSRRYPKRRILRDYLNIVYFGNHAYGVEAAAQTYFSRHARSLTLAQSALLAGLPQAPSVYDPFHNPRAAVARRNTVLAAMLQTGEITRRQYRWAVRERMVLMPGRIYTHIQQPYFFTYVTEELQRVYGTNTVREGGLRVYTTIQPRLQRAAKKAIRDTLYLGRRSGRGDRVHRARYRRNPGDDSGDPRQHEEPVQPGGSVGAAGRIDVQGVRARSRDREGSEPRHDLLHLRTVHVHERTVVRG